RKAIDLAHRSGNRAREAVLSSLCGAAALALDAEGAQDQLDVAMELATESADPLSLSTVLEHHAYTMAVGGDTEGAREQYVRSIQVIEQPEALGVVHPFE